MQIQFKTSKNNHHLPYQGLTTEQVEINRKKYGLNILNPPQKNPWWQLFLEKFEDPVIQILAIAAVIAIAVGIVENNYLEGIGIIVAILLATTLAFINEYQADKEFNVLNQVSDTVPTKVIRNYSFTTVPRKDLVVGDIIYLEQGEEVPADGIILSEISFYVDQSRITGESTAVKKYSQELVEEKASNNYTYPTYRVYRSTLVDRGHAYIKLTAVGDRTEIGELAIAATTIDAELETPLNLQLDKLSKLIGVTGLGFASLTFIALLTRGFLLGEYSLTLPQCYRLGLSMASVLAILTPVWLPVIYDGLELAEPVLDSVTCGACPRMGEPNRLCLRLAPMRGLSAALNVSEIETPEWLEEINLNTWLKASSIGLGILGAGVGLGYFAHLLPVYLNDWLPTSLANALLQYFMVAVTIVVVAVPEGLAMSVTLSLAYSMRKMAADQNLVRRMHACETIGATTVICSDKTGTLTQNQMRVHQVHFPSLHSPLADVRQDAQNLIAEAISANSTADLETLSDRSFRPLGNATEGSLLLWLADRDLDYVSFRSNFAVEAQIPFATKNKYMGTLGKSAIKDKDNDVFYLKGAPEIVLARCSQILTESGLKPLDNKEDILATLQTYQQSGMRTLAIAYRDLAESPTNNLHDLVNNLTWLGLIAIEDPLRPEVPDAIATCQDAGIEVKIVTGDNPKTAQEISRQIGLSKDTDSQYAYLTGQEFNSLAEEEAQVAAQELKVLSRARPLDKLRLVKLLQANGEVVGVTGDGTNDAPALQQAQVGLAMGSGTAIAKEASDIILLNDSFSSIVNSVVWGRSLYENIQKFILFQLTINVAALGIVLFGPFIGVAMPLTVTQMLWVNLIMDTFAALALATEPPNPQVIKRQPRPVEAFIISQPMLQNIITTGFSFLAILTGFLLYIGRDGSITTYELSLFFTTFVMLQFWNMFNARCLGSNQSAFKDLLQNKAFIAIASVIFFGQILIIQFGGSIFRTVPLSLTDWLTITSLTSIVLVIGEIKRSFAR